MPVRTPRPPSHPWPRGLAAVAGLTLDIDGSIGAVIALIDRFIASPH